MLVIATSMGVASSFLGAYASYFLDVSTGGCVVVLQTSLFLFALICAPKHGVLASRRNARFSANSLSRSASTPAGSNAS
jgi:hypothetical protein